MRRLIFLLNLILLISFFLTSCEKKKEYVNISFPDGRTYEGEWKMGNPNGQGKFTYPKLGKYVGDIRMAYLMVKVNSLGLMVASMRDYTVRVNHMVMAKKFFLMVKNMLGNTKKVDGMVKDQ